MGRLGSGVRKRKNGIYEKRFSINGKRISVYGKTLQILSEKEENIRKDIRTGIYDNRNIILDTYFERWITNRRLYIKENTICTYRSYYYKHLSHLLGKRKLQQIKPAELRLVQECLANSLKASTANICFKVLKAVLNDAVTDEIITYNPAKGIRPIKEMEEKAINTYHRALTINEQDMLMSELKNDYYYEFIAFMLCSGMRIGEVAALTWNDIENDIIHINKTLTRSEIGKSKIGNSTKTNASMRDIPLTDTLESILINWNNKEKKKVLKDERIFYSIQGRIVQSGMINRAISRAIHSLKDQGYKIDHFTSHGLRDCYATRFIEQGGNMQTLKTLLGHKSLAMTMDLYSHVLPSTKKAEADRVKFNIVV